MLLPIIFITFWSVLSIVFIDPLSIIIPSFDTIQCAFVMTEEKGKFSTGGFAYRKWYIVLNKITIIIVNFIESAYLYYIWQKMKKIKYN